MKNSRLSGAQIVRILKEADAGMKVLNPWRKHGINNTTFYIWRER